MSESFSKPVTDTSRFLRPSCHVHFYRADSVSRFYGKHPAVRTLGTRGEYVYPVTLQAVTLRPIKANNIVPWSRLFTATASSASSASASTASSLTAFSAFSAVF